MKRTATLACNILLTQLFFWAPYNAMAQEPGSPLPEALLSAFGEAATRDRETERRITSVLQKLGKTLILEHTRGAKEISLYRTAVQAVVLVVATKDSIGSGAIIDEKGHIITNWHVVGAQPYVVVVFKPKDSTELKKELAFRATVEKIDQVADLALLRIAKPPKSFTSLRLGDISTLAVGQDVHAIGHPSGEVWTYTTGIISQIRANYAWSTSEGLTHRANVIQNQTPVNPGNSGGPLLNDSGEVIGINSFRRQGEGLNYAVAVDVIQEFLGRQTSEEITTAKRSGATKDGSRCTETYNSKGWGWPDIEGCYLRVSAPPPDFWLVHRDPKGPVTYVALDSLAQGHIDTVITSKNQQWRTLQYYKDLDCNGTVDLIGLQYKGSDKIDRYMVPARSLSIPIMALELDGALKAGRIPYPTLRVCQ